MPVPRPSEPKSRPQPGAVKRSLAGKTGGLPRTQPGRAAAPPANKENAPTGSTQEESDAAAHGNLLIEGV